MTTALRAMAGCLLLHMAASAQAASPHRPVAQFQFDGHVDSATHTSVTAAPQGHISFADGLDGQALRLASQGASGSVKLHGKGLQFDPRSDFSLRFWIKTSMNSDSAAAILSQKPFADSSLSSQTQPGWALYFYRGTWAWNIGSGTRRLTYERENGRHMPLNDGRWHQLAMTYDSATSQIRLFYDGDNKVLYNVADSSGFDFTSTSPVVVGGHGETPDSQARIRPEILTGAEALQELVTEFNRLGVGDVEPEEFESMLVDPAQLVEAHLERRAAQQGADSLRLTEAMAGVDLSSLERLRGELKKNPYTVHQARSFMEVAPLLKLYSLSDGKVAMREQAALAYTERVRLAQPDFDMDELTIWDRALSPDEVRDSYRKHFEMNVSDIDARPSLVAADWNIYHGGKHYTVEADGWDSRLRVAEILKANSVDVVMMQETYSSGDYVAAELGFYFATTVDWDYLHQGANISVLSRYPIKDIYVPQEAPFNNVAVTVEISKTQDLYVMSNWYGMQSFPVVFEFHKGRFDQSDAVPTLFAGDFNAVPHTDGGDSPASRALLEAGFSDAFRSLYPDVETYPGPSHDSGHRIDQLYYKGKGLRNTWTKVVSSWPGGFPADHFLVLAGFDLSYSSVEQE